jgi:hypothetical protein
MSFVATNGSAAAEAARSGLAAFADANCDTSGPELDWKSDSAFWFDYAAMYGGVARENE